MCKWVNDEWMHGKHIGLIGKLNEMINGRIFNEIMNEQVHEWTSDLIHE